MRVKWLTDCIAAFLVRNRKMQHSVFVSTAEKVSTAVSWSITVSTLTPQNLLLHCIGAYVTLCCKNDDVLALPSLFLSACNNCRTCRPFKASGYHMYPSRLCILPTRLICVRLWSTQYTAFISLNGLSGLVFAVRNCCLWGRSFMF